MRPHASLGPAAGPIVARKPALSLLLALALTGCGLFDSDPEAAEVRVQPSSVTLTSLGAQEDFSATVLDGEGTELPGQPVEWSVSDPAVASVSSDGRVTAIALGSTSVVARSGEASGRATVTVAPRADSLNPLTPLEVTGVAGAPVDTVRVEALDALGNPVAGVELSASVVTGGGSVSPTTFVTGANGQGTTLWTLGSTSGVPQRIVVESSGASPLVYSATALVGPPDSVVLLSGDGQAGTPGATLPVPLRIRVTDEAGNEVNNVSALFSVETGSGSLSATEVPLSSQGEAESSWTLGAEAGEQTVRITVDELERVVTATVFPDASALVVVSDPAPAGVVGTVLDPGVQVRLEDGSGSPVPDAPIRFTVEAGSGSVSDGSTVGASVQVSTDGSGVATLPAWTLGTAAGSQTLQVLFPGLPGQVITALAGPGAPDELVVAGGDFQTALVSSAVPEDVVFEVRDEYGNIVPGAVVDFSAGAGSGSPGASSGSANAEGRIAVSWTLGSAVGLQTLTASTGGIATGNAYAAGLLPVTGDYDIDVRFLTPGIQPSIWAAFQVSANTWERIITGDVVDIQATLPAGACGAESPALDEVIDDLVIFATIEFIDGAGENGRNVLGSAGPCGFRPDSDLPALGRMRFDVFDILEIEERGSLNALILHEIGHVLGIGTAWSRLGLLIDRSSSDETLDTHFDGADAIAEFDAAGGTSYDGAKVPVENRGASGTINGHWREPVLDPELMTGSLDANPRLSRITIGSLADLGYVVDYGPADPFSLAPADRLLTDGPAPLPLHDDIMELPRFYLGPGR